MPTGNRDIGALGHPRSLQPRRKTEGTEQLTAQGGLDRPIDQRGHILTWQSSRLKATHYTEGERETEQRQREIDPHPISDHGLLIVV